MNSINTPSRRVSDPGLQNVIEPLASYICATDRPRAVLNRIVAALMNEIEQTNRLARSHVARRAHSGFTN